MTIRRGALYCGTLLFTLSLALSACGPMPEPGTVKDEAMLAGRDAKSFPAAGEDYFHDMDGGLALDPAQIQGRNTWIVWTGGDDHLWDTIARKSTGALDFLKTISSYPGENSDRRYANLRRETRWKYLGLVNEPCYEQATGPDPKRFGLWLDQRKADCPPDPFEDESRYPGVKIGARGKNLPVGSFYGWGTGIVGLRLFPNPDFDEAAAKKWDPVRYYNDKSYYLSKDLVKPFRVGMSCGFCHVGPNPVKPPADPENPKWENLSSNVGAQYFWIERIFDWDNDASSYIYQMFHTSRPGTLDTSLISTDNINNPRTMNAVYYLGPRLEQALRYGKESLSGGSADNKQFNDFLGDNHPLSRLYQKPAPGSNEPPIVWSPRVLKDGADSVGGLGALNRVYLNIGLFSEEWLLHFNPLIGGKPTTAILIKDARRNSSYWNATEQQTLGMAEFFLGTTAPHHLKDAPGGEAYLTKDATQLTRGKVVFAEHCARCHSSKGPPPPQSIGLVAGGGCSGKNYLTCWNEYWDWTKTEDFKSKMREIVAAPDFLENNYLSTEMRVPVTLLQTNACSPLATNAIEGNIWDNFSSRTYKDLPSVGSVTVHDPFTGKAKLYEMPGGGRGFTRPASLISLWSTAPYLLNNTVGDLNPGYGAGYKWPGGYEPSPAPSVEARLKQFQDGIEKMLWPEKRDRDERFESFALDFNKVGTADEHKLPGHIDRTTQTSSLRVARGYLPDKLRKLQGWNERLLPWAFKDDYLELGRLPKGTPINLIANIDLLGEKTRGPAEELAHVAKVADLLLDLKKALKSLPDEATDDQLREAFAKRNLGPRLLEFSKCPDFVVNRGHYFGTGYVEGEPALSDEDKRALIELLKTF
ncbi:MAG: hypothetical protein WDO68_17075 [Gammaproteobacteria bacterium]